MFEEYINQLRKRPPDPDPTYHPLDMGSSITLNPYLLIKKLSNIELLSTDEIYRLVIEYYSMILDKNFIDTNKVLIAKAFTNERFVTTFAQAISRVNQLNSDHIINCNRLIYEYMVFKNKNENIMMILYNLGKDINRDTIYILKSLGISEPLAVDMAVARYSTSNLIVAMKRLNMIIINSSISIMTEQMIVNIYEKLFDNLTPMFEGIMFDVWAEEDFNDQEQEEIYGTITLAILDILREAPFEYIVSVISIYAQDHQYLYSNDPVRINLRAIAVSDYKRILDAIDYVEQQLNINIPANTRWS